MFWGFLKKANIENLSSLDIDGHKNTPTILMASNWFSGDKTGNESSMFFSFEEDEKIEALFNQIKKYNLNLEITTLLKRLLFLLKNIYKLKIKTKC